MQLAVSCTWFCEMLNNFLLVLVILLERCNRCKRHVWNGQNLLPNCSVVLIRIRYRRDQYQYNWVLICEDNLNSAEVFFREITLMIYRLVAWALMLIQISMKRFYILIWTNLRIHESGYVSINKRSSGQAKAPANASMQWQIVLICLFLQMNSITKLNVN
jgi:hypothetical protein